MSEKKEHESALVSGTAKATEAAATVGEHAASAAEKIGGEQLKHPIDAAKVGGSAVAYGAKVGANLASAMGGIGSSHASSGMHGHSRVVRAARGHPVAPTNAQHSVPPPSGPVSGQHAAQGHASAPIVPVAAQAVPHLDPNDPKSHDMRLVSNRHLKAPTAAAPASPAPTAPTPGGKNTKQNHQKQWETRRKAYGASGRGGH